MKKTPFFITHPLSTPLSLLIVEPKEHRHRTYLDLLRTTTTTKAKMVLWFLFFWCLMSVVSISSGERSDLGKDRIDEDGG